MIARRFTHACTLAAAASLLAACAVPTTQLGTVSADAVRNEQLEQQQLAIQWDLRQQQRVEDVGHALLAAAVPFCNGAPVPRTGVRFANLHSFARDYQWAARSLGFSDTLVVVGVAYGSAAERAGIVPGDRVTALDGGSPPLGKGAMPFLARALGARRTPGATLTFVQGDTRFLDAADAAEESAPAAVAMRAEPELRAAIPADTVCGYNLIAARKDDLNAWADGTNVTVTSAMLRFVADDDELAAVLAHEIAHNAMRHIQARQKNAAMGGILGGIVDIAAATQGINTQGQFTQLGVDVGSLVFSQDFENEADYVGMYLLARAGRPTAKPANFWRRMAQEDPRSIKYASTHPTTAERFVRLEQVSAEIDGKLQRGEELRPEMRGAPASPPRAVASVSKPAASTASPKASAAVPNASPATQRSLTSNRSPASVTTRTSGGEAPRPSAGSSDRASIYSTTLSTADSVSYTFGPPAPRNGLTIAQVRRRALEAFQDGNEALELRLYEQAETRYRDAVLYDGGEARYHAALGALLHKRGKRAAAEAALSAAVLLDVDNAAYRQLLVEVRQAR